MAPPLHCAVLGSPVAHSLSPAMHRAAYAELGLDWTYEAIEVDRAGLAAFLDGLDGSWRGLSVTAPLKRTLVGLLDDVSDDVEFLGVANTVVLGERRAGFNTDVPGAVAALREAGLHEAGTARVLGGGATAASLVLALSRLGVRTVDVVVRDPLRAAEVTDVARRCGVVTTISALDDLGAGAGAVDVLVSTIPAAAVPEAAAAAAPVVFDALYDPWPTPLAHAAAAGGATVVSGLDLLAHQAALQVHLMTGRSVAAALLRSAAAAELARR